MLVDNSYGSDHNIWAFVDSVPNNLQLTFFKLDGETGKMVQVCYMRNKPGKPVWDEKSITFNRKFIEVVEKISNPYSGQPDYFQMKINKPKNPYNASQSNFNIIGCSIS